MPEPTYGRFSPNEVRKRILDSDWVSATPQLAQISSNPAPSATKTTYAGYVVMTFTATGTLNVSGDFGGSADALIVTGGGTAGVGNGASGGSSRTLPLTLSANTPIPIVVGGAGTASIVNGAPSQQSATPGGGGGTGAPNHVTPATPGQPGNMINNYRTGSNTTYGGGGGGGAAAYRFPGPGASGASSAGSGGAGGGGPGGGASGFSTSPGSPGQVNTGGGGGGGGKLDPNNDGQYNSTSPGGTGGSGIVVLRFPSLEFE